MHIPQLITICLALLSVHVRAAAPRTVTLDEAICLARARSVDAAVAVNELRSAYWEYRTYKANLLPEASFRATIPAYYKQYSPYMDSDGQYSFVRNNYIEMSGQLSVSQKIWLTGGTLSINTDLDFLRQLDAPRYNRLMSIPVALTLNQPLFSVNSVKWDRKIEPLRYAEAKAAFMSQTEEVAIQAINLYFNLLMAMETAGIARQNLANAELLYNVAVEKREIGQISRNDLLQMELNMLNARSALTEAESERKSMMFRLRTFLDIGEDDEITPEIPPLPGDFTITYDDALRRALDNNKFYLNIRRRQLQADYEVERAKGNMRDINLFAQVGYTGTATRLKEAYNPLNDNQVVEVGVSIPLVDWGKRRGQVKVAESNRQVVKERIRQENQTFSQDLFILVEKFNNQRSQLALAMRSDTISARRYATNVETYLIGRLSTLDLNDSQVTKDEARLAYVNQLYLYWLYLYQIRSLTLWDYSRGSGIDADIEAVLSAH